MFRYTVLSRETDSDGIVAANTITLNGASIQDLAGNTWTPKTLTLPVLTGVLVDATEPAITGVSATQGTYKTGDVVEITATFSEVVTPLGTPMLTLQVGDGVAIARFSGAGRTAQTTQQFSYTVANGHNGVVNITGVSGSIRDNAGQDVPTTWGTPLSLQGITVDTIVPHVTGIADDPNIQENKTWTWSCEDISSCTYRHVVNREQSYQFSASAPYNSTTTVSPSLAVGVHYIHVQAKDAVGNESAIARGQVRIELPPQLLSIVPPPSGTYIFQQTMDLSLRFPYR